MQQVETGPVARLGRHGVAFRLWLAVGATILALSLVAAFSAVRSARQQRQVTEGTLAMDAKLDAALRWVCLTSANAVRIQATAASNEPAVLALFADEIPAVTNEVNQVKMAIDAMPLTERDKALMATAAVARSVMADSPKAQRLTEMSLEGIEAGA